MTRTIYILFLGGRGQTITNIHTYEFTFTHITLFDQNKNVLLQALWSDIAYTQWITN